jgi:hypothetical protein
MVQPGIIIVTMIKNTKVKNTPNTPNQQIQHSNQPSKKLRTTNPKIHIHLHHHIH